MTSTDTATAQITIGSAQGCTQLTQRVLRFGPGDSGRRDADGADEVWFVQSGSATLHLIGGTPTAAGPDPLARHELTSDMAAHVAAGESFWIENPGPSDLMVVAVTVPTTGPPAPDQDSPPGAAGGPRQITMRLAEQEAHTTGDRTFRVMASPASGCHEVTQFVGEIPPGAAPPHSHTYDEIVYVLSGTGICHVDGQDRSVAAGEAIYLPPYTEHCMENVGNDTLRVLGVFCPAGDPSSKASHT